MGLRNSQLEMINLITLGKTCDGTMSFAQNK